MKVLSNNSLVTCIANDYGYSNIFSSQIKNSLKDGDLLLNFSASGNSENLVQASLLAKEKGVKVASIVGFDGGKLKTISDISVHCPTKIKEFGQSEDAHLFLCHFISKTIMESL